MKFTSCILLLAVVIAVSAKTTEKEDKSIVYSVWDSILGLFKSNEYCKVKCKSPILIGTKHALCSDSKFQFSARDIGKNKILVQLTKEDQQIFVENVNRKRSQFARGEYPSDEDGDRKEGFVQNVKRLFTVGKNPSAKDGDEKEKYKGFAKGMNEVYYDDELEMFAVHRALSFEKKCYSSIRPEWPDIGFTSTDVCNPTPGGDYKTTRETIIEAVNMWYKGRINDTSALAQMVYDKTTAIGCAMIKRIDSKKGPCTFVTCNYAGMNRDDSKIRYTGKADELSSECRTGTGLLASLCAPQKIEIKGKKPAVLTKYIEEIRVNGLPNKSPSMFSRIGNKMIGRK